MKRVAVLLFGAFSLLGAASASAKPNKQLEQALALTPEHFRDTAVVKDDDLEVTATITTANGFSEKRGLLKIVWDDNFLRAFIDKKTGAVTYQLYQYITYTGDWHYYYGANYLDGSGDVQQAELTVISRDVNSCSARGGCDLTETFGFNVPESLLRAYASKYSPSAPSGWQFKFKAKDGTEWKDGMLSAEIAGLLEAVDDYKKARGLPLQATTGS